MKFILDCEQQKTTFRDLLVLRKKYQNNRFFVYWTSTPEALIFSKGKVIPTENYAGMVSHASLPNFIPKFPEIPGTLIFVKQVLVPSSKFRQTTW